MIFANSTEKKVSTKYRNKFSIFLLLNCFALYMENILFHEIRINHATGHEQQRGNQSSLKINIQQTIR